MKFVANLLAVAIVTLVFAGVGYAGFLGAGEIGNRLGEVDVGARATLLTVGTVALLATVILVGGLRSAARRVGSAHLDRERAELYRLLVSHWRRVIDGEPAMPDDGTLDGLEAELVLLGSNAVVRAYMGVKENAGEGDQLLIALVQAMRADLGRARGFDEGAIGDLLSVRGHHARPMELQQQA